MPHVLTEGTVHTLYDFFRLPKTKYQCKKCIRDAAKGPARRNQPALRKNTFCGTPVSVPLLKFCEKLLSSRKISLKSSNRLLRCGKKRFLIWRPSALLIFRNLEFMSRDLYHHAILLRCAKFNSNRTIWCRVIGKKQFSRWRISAILNFRGPIMGSLKSPCIGIPIGRQRRLQI